MVLISDNAKLTTAKAPASAAVKAAKKASKPKKKEEEDDDDGEVREAAVLDDLVPLLPVLILVRASCRLFLKVSF